MIINEFLYSTIFETKIGISSSKHSPGSKVSGNLASSNIPHLKCLHPQASKILKVSKFQKQIFFFSFPPKIRWNYFLEKLNWDSQQGRDLATSGRNKKKVNRANSYIMRKVWYHQIWIQNNLGFMVLILWSYIPK